MNADSRMNWFDFGGQRSKPLQPSVHPMHVNVESHECLEDIFSNECDISRMPTGFSSNLVQIIRVEDQLI